jgi:hypothetical protein
LLNAALRKIQLANRVAVIERDYDRGPYATASPKPGRKVRYRLRIAAGQARERGRASRKLRWTWHSFRWSVKYWL